MSVTVDGKKFLELIAGNEMKVAKLYRDIGDEVGLGQGFFERMAADEDKHEIIYRGLLGRHENDLIRETEASTAHYVELLLENDLLQHVDELVESARHLNFKSQIFDLCERIERDSVMYVREFMDLYPDVAPQEMKIILQEEKKHLQMILEKKADRSFFGIGM
ncbi:hypothetical protein ABB02_01768 [Clostridiaceae bacterium JG1575]|nr:hypothetical protein ABB02_01768 [Clostridiaceae bacterium JG1575]